MEKEEVYDQFFSPFATSLFDDDSSDDSVVSTFVPIINASILVYNSLRRRTKLTRSGIVHPNNSAWRKLLKDGDESSFITMTGFTKKVFKSLLLILFPKKKRRIEKGRPSIATISDKLGLVLLYLGSRMNLSQLSMLFGFSVAVVLELVAVASALELVAAC